MKWRIRDKLLVSVLQTHLAQMWVFNPILTVSGGGVNEIDPPYTKSATASRPPQIENDTPGFHDYFSFKSYASFDTIFATIGREVTWRFVLARRHKICPKSAFCICVCTKHMEITDFLKMH